MPPSAFIASKLSEATRKRLTNVVVIAIITGTLVFIVALICDTNIANAESTVYNNPKTNVVLSYSRIPRAGHVFETTVFETKTSGFTKVSTKQYGSLMLSKRQPAITIHHPAFETITGTDVVWELYNKQGSTLNRYKITRWRNTALPLQIGRNFGQQFGLLYSIVVGLNNPKLRQQPTPLPIAGMQ